MRDFAPFVVVGIVTGSVYGLAGLGLVVTYKTTGIFNFAHGAIAAAAASAFYELHVLHGVAWPVSLVATLLIFCPAMGLLLELITRQLTNAPVVTKIVATLGLLISVQQLAVIRYGAATRQFPAFLPTRTLHVAGVSVGVDQLIVTAVGVAAAGSLSMFFRATRLGRAMRGVVDNAELVSMTGVSPTSVRRWAWCVGATFAGLSGVLLAPTIGLDATILSLLVVYSFGAAAVGLFKSLPLTFAGGVVIGVAAAVSSKYIGSVRWLGGIPPSLPFIVLFALLVAVPRARFADIGTDRKPRVSEGSSLPAPMRYGGAAVAVAAAVLVPSVVGTRLPVYTSAMVMFVVFLSLALLVRTSAQVSLAQLGFAAVGAAAFSHFADGFGIPFPVAVLAAGLVAVPVGAIVAIPAIRLSGIYLALATFGFGLLLERLVYPTAFMFGGRANLPAPRPSIGQSDHGYYYVTLLVAVMAVSIVGLVRRSRLGRLLRAMADSPLGLSAFGTNVTVIKVEVFCISAFLAGVGGALLGPTTGTVNGYPFGTFQSLLLVVVLVMVNVRSEALAAAGAAVSLVVVPAYVRSESLNQWFPVLFGVAAIAVAITESGGGVTAWASSMSSAAAQRLRVSPGRARLEHLRRALAEGRP